MGNFELFVRFALEEYRARWAEIRQMEWISVIPWVLSLTLGVALVYWQPVWPAATLLLLILVATCVWMKVYIHSQMHRSGRYVEVIEETFQRIQEEIPDGKERAFLSSVVGWHSSRARGSGRSVVGAAGTISFGLVQLTLLAFGWGNVSALPKSWQMSAGLLLMALIPGLIFLFTIPKAGARRR